MSRQLRVFLAVLFLGLLAFGEQFIHNGRFLDIEYRADLNRHKIQPYWTTAPKSYSAFRLLKDVEADVANSHIKVKTQKAPNGGFKNLILDSEFVAIPHSPVKISWRARGNGKLAVYVYEYILNETGRKIFQRRAVTIDPQKVTEAWKTYSTTYVPKTGELGAVMIRFNFLPAEGESLDIDLTEVSATGDGVERSALPATFVIPKAKQPLVNPKDWKEGLILTGFKDNYNALPEAGVTQVKASYDDQMLYIGFTVDTGEPPVAVNSARDSNVFRDDSVETVFSDIDDGKYAHFILNGNNGIFDRNSRTSSLKAVAWNPDVKMLSGKDENGYWIALAIPRAGFPVELKEDAPFKLNFLQTEKTNKGGAKTIYLNWSRACEPNSHVSAANTFHFPRAILSNTLISAGMNILPTGELELVLTNPGKEALVFCEYGTATRHLGTMQFMAPTGSKRAKLPFVPNNELGIIVVRDATGREIYRNAEVFKHRLESHLDLKQYLPLNFVELVSDITTIPTYDLKWAIDGGAKGTFHVNGKAEHLRIDIAALPYDKPVKLAVSIVGPNGEALGSRDFTILRPKTEPWFQSQLGVTDQPLPPFTPIRQENDGLSFLQTAVHYNNRALPAAMSSEGKEILAGPVTLTLDGKDIALAKRNVTSTKPNRVEWKAENALCRWTGWAEEDGFTWYTVTLKANPDKTVSSLTLDIPVRPEYAKLLSPFPVFRSGGDIDGRWCFDGTPWTSQDFKQIFTIRNEYRGVELTCEDEKDFVRKELAGSHRLFMKDGHAVLRLTFIDKPVKLTRERTYRFGLQVFPAKPLVRKPDYLANTSYIDPRTAAWNGGKDKALIRVNNFRGVPEQGTIEWCAYWNFDPMWMHADYHIRPLFTQTLLSFGNIGINYNSETGFSLYQSRKSIPSTLPKPTLAKGWHNAAITWKGQEFTLWIDKQPAAKFNAPAPLIKFNQITFGRSSIDRHADFHYQAVKISPEILPPEMMGNFQKADKTSKIAHFGRPNKNLVHVGEIRTVKTDRGDMPSTTAEYFSRLDALHAVGFKKHLAYLNRIFMFYGARNVPYTTEEGYKAFGILCDDLKSRGMGIYYGYSFGVSVDSRESKLYKDFYSIMPARLYGAPSTGFWQMCAGCRDYNDYLLYYFNDLMSRYDNLNIYTDNTFVCGRLCKNEAHGCGYRDQDDNGALKESGNLVRGRAFAKRLYAITKLRPIPREHFMHSSGQNHAIYLSWADKYLCGEQYLENTEKKGWNIDLAQFRAQNDVTRAFGVPSFAISSFVPFRHKGMLAVAGLHDVATYGAHHHRFAEDVFGYAPFLKATTEFGTYNAEFIPYYDNQGLLTTATDKQYYASAWKKPGRILIQASNLNWEDGQVTIRLALAKLGVKGTARNAATGEAIPVTNGAITLPIPAYDSRLILVE